MIRVKIVNGFAIDVEVLHDCKVIYLSKWKSVVSFWYNFVLDRFEIVGIDSNRIDVVEGDEYWALPCGKGKIYLREHINDSSMTA